jgi:hypothetical protein
VNASGQWSISLTNIGEGTSYFVARASINRYTSDASKCVTIVVDRTPPGAPTITGTNGAINIPSASFSWSAADPAPSSGCCTYAYMLSGPGHTEGFSTFGGGTTTSCSGLADGSYTFSVEATDAAANISTSASQRFIVDTTAPAATLTFPAAGTLSNAVGWTAGCSTVGICGTASDNADGSGLLGVAVAIRSSDGKYWGGSGFVNSATPIWNLANGTSTWSYPLSQPTDGTYSVQIQATDNAGNVSTTPVSAFAVDATPPTSNITFPGPGSAVSAGGWATGCSPAGVVGICGTAADNLSGVAYVFVAIQSKSGATNGMYWDGSGFNSSSLLWFLANGTTSWSLPLARPPDGVYAVASLTLDNAGNIEQLASSATLSCSTCSQGVGFSNGGFSNGGFSNGGFSNGGFSNGGFSNGGFNGGFSNGGFSNGGFSNGGFSNGGFSNGGSGGTAGCTSGAGTTIPGSQCDTLAASVDTTPPTATTTVGGQTLSASVNIDPSSTVHVQFNEPVDPSSLTNLRLTPAASPVTCDNPCFNATITGLSGATVYSLRFNGIADLAGNAISGAAPFTFTTGDASLTNTADSDGDGIPDAWDGASVNFLVNGSPVTVDTGAWGFSPAQKDLCVVENYMAGTASDGAYYNQEIMQQENQDVVNAFAAHGVHLVIFEGPPVGPGTDLTTHPGSAGLPAGYGGPWYGGQIGMTDPLGNTDSGNYDFTQFDQIRNQQFVPTGLAQFCRYAVIAHTLGGTRSSGVSRGFGSSDFIVSLGFAGTGPNPTCAAPDPSYPGCIGVGTPMQRTGTFMHELGHNLGLHHGGGDDVNFKPNYPSVMNYGFQFSGVPENGHWVLDYSSGTLPLLDETRLSESGGLPQPSSVGATVFGTEHICPGATGPQIVRTVNATSNVNWNCDVTGAGADIIESGAVPYDANGDGQEATLSDHNDWASLSFKGGTVGFGESGPLPTTSTIDVSDSPDGPPPTLLNISANATNADGTAFVSGTWTNQSVTVHFSCAFAGMPVPQPICPNDQNFSADGSNQSATGTVSAGGETQSAGFGGINIDKTSPTVSITTPTTGTYALNQVVTAGYSCSDNAGGSGLASCADSRGGTSASPGSIDTGSTGSKSFTVTATDNAGNKTQRTVNYTVKGTPTITWPNPADITYGTPLSATQLNATANVPGTFVYSPAAGTVLNPGSGQMLSATFTPTDTTNYTQAMASVKINVNLGNMYILSQSAGQALNEGGQGCLNASSSIYVNSNATGNAIYQGGQGCSNGHAFNVTGAGGSISVRGGYSTTCCSPTPTNLSSLLADPLVGVGMPYYSNSNGSWYAYTYSNGNWSATPQAQSPGKISGSTLSPGVYSSISFSSGTYTLQPGVYIINGGGLKLSSSAQLSGTGVFIYNTSQSGSCGQVSVSASGTISLTAPVAGPYAKILLGQDRSCATAASLTAGSALSLGGAVYMPAAALTVNAQSAATPSWKSAIITNTLLLAGKGNITLTAP